ncbi:bifunctional phosphoglucose/phosphomannose isomerase [Candidatus Nanosynbacter lyticus]|uniref:bifunctional phosphoglucose/phosphomannose isomerase n=1 Tax=Candidatus Nanosynbacter lyticus TaxID=2093824 RepID=UPI0025534588|nr:bifunctional phosphoglucose/phosphomannose isomerase [Candidatus Nanosynbacter lyticus]WLD46439.1 bifunctional phosphoglucose/phosphomannose isomerase [Candidatus Nanosynbacter lyticus]
MLDDKNLLAQRDPGSTRTSAVAVTMQTDFAAEVESPATPSEVANVVLAGMGGSALAADMVKVLTADRIMVPLEVVKGYQLPNFVNEKTLVIAISHSGNTEETMSCYQQAREHGCQLAVMATGGKLFMAAEADNLPRVRVPSGGQPRMSTIYHLRGLLKLLSQFEVIDDSLYHAVATSGVWLKDQLSQWAEDVPTADNYAKQLALKLVGSTQVFYAGELTWPLAYKWKISFNESAKNVAFWNQYPEFSHNEFIGWSSHPVDKPYKVVDFRSSLERPRIRERMELTDRLLSGMRPKAEVVELQGKTLLEQLLWGLALGEIVSIYAGILNGVNPEPVALVEQLKRELS